MNCTRFDIIAANGEKTDYKGSDLQGKSRDRSGAMTIPKKYLRNGKNVIVVRVFSDDGKVFDNIRVTYGKDSDARNENPKPSNNRPTTQQPRTTPKPTQNDNRNTSNGTGRERMILTADGNYYDMVFCGGQVRAKIVNNDLSIDFRAVESCSQFDIVSANYEVLNYGIKKLDGTDRNRSGSYTIPDRFVQTLSDGMNVIRVQMESGSGKTGCVIDVIVPVIDLNTTPRSNGDGW